MIKGVKRFQTPWQLPDPRVDLVYAHLYFGPAWGDPRGDRGVRHGEQVAPPCELACVGCGEFIDAADRGFIWPFSSPVATDLRWLVSSPLLLLAEHLECYIQRVYSHDLGTCGCNPNRVTGRPAAREALDRLNGLRAQRGLPSV